MARVRALEKEEVRDADVLRVFERQERAYGKALYNHAVLARRPAIFRGFRAMWDELDRGALLGARLICLVNVRVAGLIGCSLCVEANAKLSRNEGVTDGDLRSLFEPATSERFSEREKAALAYAEAMTVSNTVDDEIFESVRQQFSEEEIIELTATIAWEICSAKFNRALQIEWGGAATCPIAAR